MDKTLKKLAKDKKFFAPLVVFALCALFTLTAAAIEFFFIGAQVKDSGLHTPLALILVGAVLTTAATLSSWKASYYVKRFSDDVYNRRQTEVQLSEARKVVALTAKITKSLKAEQDLESLVQEVTDLATEISGAMFGAFFYGANKSVYSGTPVPGAIEIFRQSFAGKTVVLSDELESPVRSFLSAPVVSKDGRILGSLMFAHPEPGIFTPRSEIIVESLAIQTGSAMDNTNLYRELSAAKSAADAANQAKSLFLANVSHEIRTPLGIMLGFAELTAENRNEPEIVASNIQKIIRNGKELTRIIGEVLDLSKIEANTLLIETNNFCLTGFMKDFESEWRFAAASKNLTFEMIAESTLPGELRTDSTRFTQILTNLVSNAIKFTQKGGIRVHFSYQAEGPSQGTLKVSVEDSGLGIASQHHLHVFDAFYQCDNSITRKFGGSGLGLALSKQLAKALGGNLALIHSTPGVGSCFNLTLPMRFEKPMHVDHKIPSVPPSERGSAPIRVLLVEDSIDNQLLISTFLTKANAVVDTACNGKEGVEKATSGDYDIVLMDIQMPVLDGYGAFRKLKELGYNRPIIALTAHALLEEKERAFALGFHDYLTKPVNRQTLISAVLAGALSS